MPNIYHFTEEQIAELSDAKKKNKNKNVDKRLNALLLRAQGIKRVKVAETTGFCKQYITDLTANFHNNGLSAVTENHYKGNNRNMSYEEEKKLLETFKAAAESGQIVDVKDILLAYEKKLGRSVEKDRGRIYRVLQRHGWRKVMPRTKHPKKASEEEIESSKKLTLPFESNWKILTQEK